MSENVFTVEVERVGNVDLMGMGPWTVHEFGRGSYEIRDKDMRAAKPTVWRATGGSNTVLKSNQNVIWAQKSVPARIVEVANAAWEARSE